MSELYLERWSPSPDEASRLARDLVISGTEMDRVRDFNIARCVEPVLRRSATTKGDRIIVHMHFVDASGKEVKHISLAPCDSQDQALTSAFKKVILEEGDEGVSCILKVSSSARSAPVLSLEARVAESPAEEMVPPSNP